MAGLRGDAPQRFPLAPPASAAAAEPGAKPARPRPGQTTRPVAARSTSAAPGLPAGPAGFAGRAKPPLPEPQRFHLRLAATAGAEGVVTLDLRPGPDATAWEDGALHLLTLAATPAQDLAARQDLLERLMLGLDEPPSWA
jgi:hypothetical protein